MSDRGWIYCITSQENKQNNIYKIGMSSKIDLEEDIRTHLMHRYGTTYPEPDLCFLSKVSFPKKVEKLILDELIQYKRARELVQADYQSVVYPCIIKHVQKYPYDNAEYIDDDLYRKYVMKLEKNMTKLVKNALKGDTNMHRHLRDYFDLYFNKGILNQYNNSILCNLYNNVGGLYAPILSSHDTYTNEQKIIRKNWENCALHSLKSDVSYWDKTDPNIHKFLKGFSKIY
jgi:hypothetical protein